jgi:ribosomal protein L11 methyltransferase
MLNIAPRVAVYSAEEPAPELAEGWIGLALARVGSSEFVFGDGSHPTTRLCAGAVDLLCRQRRPQAVLDVGTGTGVLARIARARGAQFVVGTDIDPVALANARANCAVDGVVVSSEPPDHWGRRFDLIVANILEAPLVVLAGAMARALRPDGMLLLSGFTRLQLPALRLAYENAGLGYVRHSGLGEWALLMLTLRGAGEGLARLE